MHNGKELGQAIANAIDLKIKSGAVSSKAEIARHFKIKPPSIHDWINKGSISKDKLPELWLYFSDVVGPDNWGLPAWPFDIFISNSDRAIGNRHVIKSPPPRFEDAMHVIAMALDQADPSDRNAAKAYLVELCDKPGEVDTFAAKLARLLTPLPAQANGR